MTTNKRKDKERFDDHTIMAETLGQNVKYLRLAQNINKQTFAIMVGIGRPHLNRIENGTANVRLSLVQRMADALATSPELLLFGHAAER